MFFFLEPILNNVWFQICLELYFPVYYMVIYNTIYEYYLKNSYDLLKKII